MNKEDIWIAHIPVNGWEQNLESSWRDKLNIYQPKWSKVELIGENGIRMEECEPFDYVHVQHVMKSSQKKTISFVVKPLALHEDGFYIEIRNEKHQPAMRLTFRENPEDIKIQEDLQDGRLCIRTTAEVTACQFNYGDSLLIQVELDCQRYVSQLSVVNQETKEVLVSRTDRFLGAVREISEIGFRTGPVRREPNLETDPDHWVDLDRNISEQPGKNAVCEIYDLSEV